MIAVSHVKTTSLWLVLACGIPGWAAAQDVPLVRLDPPAATFPRGFSRIVGFWELRNGTVLVTDQLEEAIQLLDFASGRAQALSREGQGPGEYGMVGRLLAVNGDTTLMDDAVNGRFLRIFPDGRVDMETVPRTSVGSGGDGYYVFPRGVDRQGRYFFDLAGIVAAGADYGAKGVSPVFRFDPASGTTDSVAYLRFPPMLAGLRRAGRSGVGPGISLGAVSQAYQPRDDWAVDGDGRVAVVRHDDYHVEWHAPGRPPVNGPSVRHQPVPVGTAEKEAWLRSRGGGTMTVSDRQGTRQFRAPQPRAEDVEWPATLPPFTGTPRITPEGDLWVQRSLPAAVTRPRFDVFDRGGRLVRQIELPEGRRLLGFGRAALYAIRTDADGLQWLEKFRR